MHFPDEDDDSIHPRNPRMPRRVGRLVHIDRAVMRVLETHLDAIDRRAPLPSHSVDAVNAALVLAAPVCARLPRRLRPATFPRETPLRPAHAFLALLKVHDSVNQLVDELLEPPADAPSHSPPLSQP